MLVVMRHDATDAHLRDVVQAIETLGYEARPIPGSLRTAVGIVGNDGRIDATRLSSLDGVREVMHITKPYRRVSREWRADDTVVALPGGLSIGGHDIPIIAGPCAVESEEQIHDVAHLVRAAGGSILRGGAFKPRTSPYSFQGLGKDALRWLRHAADETGLLVITEVMDPESAELVEAHSDIIQIGARNMQNFSLLRRVGRLSRPILLKRGIAATITEWLLSAEYLMNEGNEQIVLCERGIRSFDQTTRNVLDLAAIPATRQLTHLPVIADPSHGTGDRDLVIPMARAAIAAGADGVMVEVHPHPDQALSDGAQSLYPKQLDQLMRDLEPMAAAVGRRIVTPAATLS